MQTIKPLSAVDVATTQANFPALVMALLPDNISGNALSCAVSDLVLTNSAGWVVSGDTFRSDGASSITVAGSTPALGTDDFMLVTVGTFTAVQGELILGDELNGPGMSLRPTTGYITLNGTDYHDVPALSTTAALTVVAQTRTGNTVAKYGYTDSAVQAAVAGTPFGAGIAASWAALNTSGWTFPTASNANYTGVFLFSFTSGLPSAADIRNGLTWMAQNPGKVYPGWVGKA